MWTIGVADTTFARIDLGGIAASTVEENEEHARVVRYTVPGVKDLPVAAKRLFGQGCDIVIALGMPGKMPIDKQCSHEASTGLIAVQLAEGKHVIEVFVHEDEGADEGELVEIAGERARKHALNALALLRGRTELTAAAGTGRRQGKPDAGPISVVY
ncbi:MAG: riboflavin synthase [Candidatus Micrarchaeota archaeon]|nr:riboflavin synthase [Candidatus Micrarchaeota archaeon]